MVVRYTDNGYPVHQRPLRSCGKRHSWCSVCRPDIDVSAAKRKRATAPSGRQFPNETAWQRHVKKFNLEPKEMPVGVKFNRPQLRHLFGFTTDDIRKFEYEEKKAEKERQRVLRGLKPLSAERLMSQERDKRIVEMRVEKAMTLDEIGKEEKITRERVRQILKRMEKVAGVTFPRVGRTYEEPRIVARHCPVCGDIVEVKEKKHDPDKKYFCEKHWVMSRSLKYLEREPNWQSMTKQERMRWKWRNEPAYKARQMAAAMRVYNRKKHTPEHKAKQKIYSARHNAKMKAQKEAAKPPRREWIA